MIGKKKKIENQTKIVKPITAVNNTNREAKDFLFDFNKNLGQVKFGYFESNNFLSAVEKNKIRVFNIALLQDTKLICLKLCQQNSDDVAKIAAFNELFKTMQKSIKILNRADHIAFEKHIANNKEKSIDMLKTAAICIYENIYKTTDSIKDIKANVYTRKSQAAAEDLINTFNIDENDESFTQDHVKIEQTKITAKEK